MAKVKRIASAGAIEAKTKKSSMKEEIITDPKVGSLVEKFADLKSQEQDYTSKAKKLKAEFDPIGNALKDFAKKLMFKNQDFISRKLIYADSSVGIIVANTVSQPDSYESGEAILDALTDIVGEDNTDTFVEFKTIVNPEAIQNEKLLKDLEVFSVAMEKKYNIKILKDQLVIKSEGLKESILSLKNAKKEQQLFDLFKPQVKIMLKDSE